jgi:cell fate regulator YaaT (PSP1 superfamily)
MTDQLRPFISVKFTPTGRVHSVTLPEPVPDPPVPGETVVVRLGEAPALGRVVRAVPVLADRRRPPADSPNVVLRRASPEDAAARQRREDRERTAWQFCLLKVRERNLPMKLARVEQVVDGSKLIFFFTADGRVDFRELVRDLAAEFRIRIEMRQIGVRDEARLLGGYGSCGRPLCCTTWLQSFEPVSIRMAKQQSLSLNPSKLSGLCGRLKCCLRYELASAKSEAKREASGGCAHDGCRAGGCGGDAPPGDGDGCGTCGCGSRRAR